MNTRTPFASLRSSRFGSRQNKAFTLVELLVVMGLIVLLASLVLPAFSGLNRAGGATKAYYDIAGLSENARTYAVANNTYVFVGFAEADVSTSPSAAQNFTAGKVGRIFAAAVASRDGTRGYDYFDATIASNWKAGYNNGARLVPISKLVTYDNLHLSGTLPMAATGPMAERPYFNFSQVGTAISQTPFNWPIGKPLDPATTKPAGSVYFDKVLTFDPDGVARIQTGTGNGISQYVELCLQQTRGAVDPGMPADSAVGNHAAISINGLTGAVRVFRP